MGAVWKARDLALDRPVAVKLLSEHLGASPEFVARFEREARMMAKLEHPNLVPIYAVGRHESAPFIVMKFLEGQTLAGLMRQRDGRLARDEVLAIMRQMCAGLAFIHGKGAIHRDLKPANIFVAPDGHVTILDLGVARTQSGQGMTRTGMLVGTPAGDGSTGEPPPYIGWSCGCASVPALLWLGSLGVWVVATRRRRVRFRHSG